MSKAKASPIAAFDAAFLMTHWPVEEGHCYQGRNGYAKCTGIELYLPSSRCKNNDGFESGVRISPRNSKNRIADTTYIEIPQNPATLREVAAKLLALADQVESRAKT